MFQGCLIAGCIALVFHGVHRLCSALQMEVNLAKFAKILGKDDKLHRKAAAARKEAINALMWNETTGQSTLRTHT